MDQNEAQMLRETRDSVIRIEGSLGALNDRVHDHSETLYGNGHPGLKINVDRLMEDRKGRMRHLAIIYGALSSLIVGGILIAAELAAKGSP